jgi:hypothetical protein
MRHQIFSYKNCQVELVETGAIRKRVSLIFEAAFDKLRLTA